MDQYVSTMGMVTVSNGGSHWNNRILYATNDSANSYYNRYWLERNPIACPVLGETRSVLFRYYEESKRTEGFWVDMNGWWEW